MKPTYCELAEVIAIELYPFFMCNHEGAIEFEHFAENNFDLSCDVLARLDVLHDASNHMRHEMRIDWRPHLPLPIIRTQNEPSYDDLIIALLRAYYWWLPVIEKQKKEFYDHCLASKPDSSCVIASAPNSLARIEFWDYAIALTLNMLVRLEMGDWIENEVFVLNSKADAIAVPGDYWLRRKQAPTIFIAANHI